MRRSAARLVSEVKASDAVYRHDNVTREKCPDCGKFLLAVQGKRGKLLVCPARECGYRRSVTQTTNARCPNCHKKMELRGEGESQFFACVCGYREKLSDFKKRRETGAAGKRDVQRYLAGQQEEKGTSAMAEQLKKWLEQNQK
jgi:DNA topoisomerase-3